MYDLHCLLQLPIEKSDGFVFAKVSSLEEHAHLSGIIDCNQIVHVHVTIRERERERERGENLLLTRYFIIILYMHMNS